MRPPNERNSQLQIFSLKMADIHGFVLCYVLAFPITIVIIQSMQWRLKVGARAPPTFSTLVLTDHGKSTSDANPRYSPFIWSNWAPPPPPRSSVIGTRLLCDPVRMILHAWPCMIPAMHHQYICLYNCIVELLNVKSASVLSALTSFAWHMSECTTYVWYNSLPLMSLIIDV